MSVQLDFKRFSVLVVLQLSCNFDVVAGGGEHSVYLLHHLDQKLTILVFQKLSSVPYNISVNAGVIFFLRSFCFYSFMW